MIIRIRTLFPEFYNEFKKTSVIGRAIENKVVDFQTIDLKKYSRKNHRVDGHPIGGGAGRIIRMEPLVNCLRENTKKSTYKIRMSPKGHPYTQKDAIRFSKRDDICIICGHYEGIDARFEDYVDEQVSVGDYILSGGEIPARLISDSIIRLLKGAIPLRKNLFLIRFLNTLNTPTLWISKERKYLRFFSVAIIKSLMITIGNKLGKIPISTGKTSLIKGSIREEILNSGKKSKREKNFPLLKSKQGKTGKSFFRKKDDNFFQAFCILSIKLCCRSHHSNQKRRLMKRRPFCFFLI